MWPMSNHPFQFFFYSGWTASQCVLVIFILVLSLIITKCAVEYHLGKCQHMKKINPANGWWTAMRGRQPLHGMSAQLQWAKCKNPNIYIYIFFFLWVIFEALCVKPLTLFQHIRCFTQENEITDQSKLEHFKYCNIWHIKRVVRTTGHGGWSDGKDDAGQTGKKHWESETTDVMYLSL